jgi:formylglycine-generating enzyme required for sulfatase activity
MAKQQSVNRLSENTLILTSFMFTAAVLMMIILLFYLRYTAPQGSYSRGNVPSLFEPDMVFVEGGTFMMGYLTSIQNPHRDNELLHQVTLSSFRIGKYEVTQAQWEAVMGKNPSGIDYGDNYPVDNVSWDDAQEFCNRLSAATGKQYRLPTEAEWEYAARGGNQSKGYIYSGSNNLNEVGWYRENSRRNDIFFKGYEQSSYPVGQKLPNELGIYDMSGNLWEWCSDWYGDYPTTAQTNPKGPSSGSHRVVRGGSWGFGEEFCYPTRSGRDRTDSRSSYYGFRVVLSDI